MTGPQQNRYPHPIGETIRLVVADAHPIVRLGIRHLAEAHQDLELVGEATDGHEVLEQALASRPDVLILDTALPGPHFLDLLRQLRSQGTKVLIFSSQTEQLYAVRAFRNGAVGFLTTESSTDDLIDAIRCIYSGHRYVTPSEAELLAVDVDRLVDAAPHTLLSDREYEVFQLLVGGSSVTEISKILSLSAKTVTTYRTRVLLKLHVGTTADLVRYAYDNDLLK